ncbi:UNVERIFIED_CONTAM: hypothetical protein Sindi_2282900 [Sesamum indicum]
MLIGDLVEQGKPSAEETQRVEELEKELQEKERKHENRVAHLRSEISTLHNCLEQVVSKLQNYPSTKEGKKGFDELWANRLEISRRTGYPPLTAPTDFLGIHVGLVDAPELDEEVPQEFPKSLLHIPPEGEVPADPENPVVEDVPLKVVPPAGDDSDAPPTAN